MSSPGDPLSGPLLRMAKFFIGEAALPRVADVKDVYELARELRRRKLPVTAGEERLLKQVVWCMLQVQNDQEDGELHQALARIAALVLAIIEDDDFEIPDVSIDGRVALEALAVLLHQQMFQVNMSIGAAIGLHDLTAQGSAAFATLEPRLPPDEDMRKALRAAVIHLRQGEGLLANQKDRHRAQAHRARLAEACERTNNLLARLLAVPAANDHPVLRKNIVRRELKRIEVDALGAQRLTEEEQHKQTRQLLAWTEVELGEQLTDDNKADLAEQLRNASQQVPSQHGDEDGGWLFGME
jgi:hypothetical protein